MIQQAIVVDIPNYDPHIASLFTGKLKVDVKLRVLVVVGHDRTNRHVLNVGDRLGQQADAPEDPGEAEHALVLDPGGGAVLEDFNSQHVSFILDVRGQVKFGRGKAVLGVTNEVTVEPNIHGPFDPFETDPDRLAAQGRIQVKALPVHANRVIDPSTEGTGLVIVSTQHVRWSPVDFPSHGINVLM